MTLSVGARRLIEHLKQYCRTKDHCWPSIAKLTREMRRDRSTIFRWISELTSKGFVVTDQRGQTSAMRFLQPLCFERDWLVFATPATANATAATAGTLLSERTSLKEEPKKAQALKTPEPTALTDEQRLRSLARRLNPQAGPLELPAIMYQLEMEGALLERKPPQNESGEIWSAAHA